MSNISVIMTANDSAEYTDICLACLQNSSLAPSEIIFVGREPAAGVRQVLQRRGAAILTVDEPGLAAAWNRGAAVAVGDILLFMNNGVFVSRDAVKIMLDTMTECSGPVGPYSNRADFGRQLANNPPYKNLDEMNEWASKAAANTNVQEDILLDDFCLMLTKEIFADVGEFNPLLAKGKYMAADYTLRARLAGYRIGIAPAFVHRQPDIGDMTGEESAALEKNTRRQFKEIWGFDLIYSTFDRSDLLNMVKPAADKIAILEIGCAAGRSLLHFRNKYPAAELYGIELDEVPAKIAATVAEVAAFDIEKLFKPEWGQKFDYIVAADIIEHLRDPWQSLKNLSSMLKPDGEIVVSIPNVAYIENLAQILNGRWDYADAGILDRTHLRFFTLQTILDMLQSVGFTPKQILSHPMPTDSFYVNLAKQLMSLPGMKVTKENLFTYQWYLRAAKNRE